MSPLRARLAFGGWHFQHGPIDLVIGAVGDPQPVQVAFEAAWSRFSTVLNELVSELPMLRLPVCDGPCPVRGNVAQRMWLACAPHRQQFITPMAAVAGAVAEELISAFDRPGINRAWINNGGDIALYLAPGQTVRVGVCSDLAAFAHAQASRDLAADLAIEHRMPVRGVATSGWRGRSFSMGIADSVTVLARSAAQADAAATMIANAVNVEDCRIVRRAASALKDDSDLEDLLVTVEVAPLEIDLIDRALSAGQRCARGLKGAGLIDSALLVCQGRAVVVGEALHRMSSAAVHLPAYSPHSIDALMPEAVSS